MLTEYLREHPLNEMLKDGVRELYPSAEDRAAWDSIPEAYRAEIRVMRRMTESVKWSVRWESLCMVMPPDGC